MKLFWVTTDDHDEDWFIVAPDAAAAARFHEDAEGYDEGDATAELVCTVPHDAPDVETGWPSGEGDIVGNVAVAKGLIEKS
jgi:hypothetical protein